MSIYCFGVKSADVARNCESKFLPWTESVCKSHWLGENRLSLSCLCNEAWCKAIHMKMIFHLHNDKTRYFHVKRCVPSLALIVGLKAIRKWSNLGAQ